jgi:nicotinate-nucleotide pyrophosphorylase (carboxylating)
MKKGEPVPEAVRRVVAAALAEDRADEDASARAVVPADRRAQARIVARASGVLAGCAYAQEAFRSCDPQAEVRLLRGDGDAVVPGDVVLEASGRAVALLAAERTALNFLQQLSGTATATAAAVAAAGGAVAVLDTRKTVPGLRDAQKAAVRAGGGRNQRRDLADELLLKENHFSLSGLDYAETVRRAVAGAEGKVVGVEAESLDEARAALAAGAHYVLLDDFPPAALADAVATLRGEFPEAVLEASGGLTPARLPEIAKTGVDRVSLGALTHSAPALDLALEMRPAEEATAPW